ncbi:MAG TPA: glutaredoxin family protein [Pseudomonadales bacterium]|nr:glutaredoxin family protein [Pseudomonadales bacterium]HNI38255.1 glutaredoxin family protein [Pseudomonadales bacterium]
MVDALHTSRLLVLYGTVGCHLCELAEQLLLPYVAEGWQVELVDIADDDRLLERLALAIPVLEDRMFTRQLCWPFDAKNLHDFLYSTPNSAVER